MGTCMSESSYIPELFDTDGNFLDATELGNLFPNNMKKSKSVHTKYLPLKISKENKIIIQYYPDANKPFNFKRKSHCDAEHISVMYCTSKKPGLYVSAADGEYIYEKKWSIKVEKL